MDTSSPSAGGGVPTAAAGNALRLTDVSHRFGATVAVDRLSLAVAGGEILSLVGPSGCGKTTLLRLIAGLETLQQGEIAIGGQAMARGPGPGVPPERRGVGLVFQDYALFPHLTVAQNVAFGLDRVAARERRARVLAALEQVGLAGLAEANPSLLSGGQQQRVALARALAPQPRAILLDEPFSGLDSRLRRQVRDDTLHLLKDAGVTTVLVTHDPEEAMFMADRIALMRDGGLVQVGTPVEVYYQPRDAFAAEFFGEVNRIAGRVQHGRVATVLGPVAATGHAEGSAVEVLLRPEGLSLRRTAEDEARPAAVARVLTSRLLGRVSLVHLAIADGAGGELHLHARVPGRFLPAAGEAVAAQIDPAQAFVFPASRT